MLAAAAGGWAGVRYGLTTADPNLSLDDILHNELDLTAEQEQKIAEMETLFAARRRELEAEMRAGNRDLAAAIGSPPVSREDAALAIERFHRAERTLQEETVEHILAMRDVLSPEQLERFDEAVTAALSSD